jgi:hippurate hydrolase
MGVIRDIARMKDEMMSWRRHLHARPELSGQETTTADYIAAQLQSFGLTAHRIGNGVIASIDGHVTTSGKAVMLRADTDALPIMENTSVAHASKNPGVMHACGHDGHMAMLLGAGKYLSTHRDFDGTVHLLFEPAEETGRGASEMIAGGLFRDFPSDHIFGLHNVPHFPLGLMGTREGEMLSAADGFTVTFTGRGGHASDPHKTTDLLFAAAAVVVDVKNNFEKHVTRGDKAVLAMTALHTASTTTNVLSDTVTLSGTMRSFDPKTQRALRAFLEKTVKEAARKVGATANIVYDCAFPVLKNAPRETGIAMRAARATVGTLGVVPRVPRTSGTEDFAYLLEQKPGNYMAMGTGPVTSLVSTKKVPGLHSAKYDFNDAALPIGATYWVRVVEKSLPRVKSPAP